MFDIAIVGAGPAGLSAAITARARGKEVVLISNKLEENPLAKSPLVDNYAGMPGVSGLAMLQQMTAHAEQLGAQFISARVVSVLPVGAQFSLTTSEELIEARTVILAPGAQRAKPLAGEDEFLGRGVSYCATCDGMLFRTATVVVVGLSAQSVEEANFLAGLGAKVSFLAPKLPTGLREDITAVAGRAVAVKGDMMGVTELVYKPAGAAAGADSAGDAGAGSAGVEKPADDAHTAAGTAAGVGTGATAGAEQSLPANGIFILRDSIAPSALIAGLGLSEGLIAVDTRMRTNLPGVFAAGDCTGAPLQVAKAVGEGQLACFSAVEFLG